MKLLPNGLIYGVEHIGSPNFDDRPSNTDIEVIIVHSISLPEGIYGGNEIQDLFCNQLDHSAHASFEDLVGLKVSAHFLIRRTGRLIQFVAVDKRAWHAGKSFCLGRERVNDFSIGIELEGCDGDTFENEQYARLDGLIDLLVSEFPAVSRNNIFGHSEIAPDRKTDPGPYFDWGRVRPRRI